MAKKIPLYRPEDPEDRVNGYIGFSWTTLFFGCLVPLLRGDLIAFLIMLFVDFGTLFITRLIFAIFYNDIQFSSLIKKGYRPYDEEILEYLRENGYMDY